MIIGNDRNPRSEDNSITIMGKYDMSNGSEGKGAGFTITKSKTDRLPGMQVDLTWTTRWILLINIEKDDHVGKLSHGN